MGFFGKLFGSKDNEDSILDENYIQTIIDASDDEPLAISESNVMYAGYNELGGYYYLQTVIIGTLKAKTKEGAKLFIESKTKNLELDADMDELEFDHASALKAYVTKIDFQIEKDDVENLSRSKIKEIKLLIKNKEVLFTIYTEKNEAASS